MHAFPRADWVFNFLIHSIYHIISQLMGTQQIIKCKHEGQESSFWRNQFKKKKKTFKNEGTVCSQPGNTFGSKEYM